MSGDDEDEEYFVPLVDQRVFGAGIKRKKIAFVPASKDDESVAAQPGGPSAAERYLAIVMKGKETCPADSKSAELDAATCTICGQVIATDTKHQNTIAHQVCLEHSLPPSHLDRSHVGVKYMQEYGWDPDSRKGLGRRQDGISIPIKAKMKNDSAGLGLVGNSDEAAKAKKTKQADSKVVKLNAKQVRKAEEEKSKRAAILRQSFYGDDLSQYLGTHG